MKKPERTRVDLALVDQGLASTRQKARALILAGQVLAGDRPIHKAGETIQQGVALRLRGNPCPYVSRGGLKLARALEQFEVVVQDKRALDIGASTGGFTDCLLQNGAARVYAIDVGHGQMAHSVATDPRVVVMDRTNIRHVAVADLPELCALSTIDVSFISLRLVLPALHPLLTEAADVVALVKPQFEVGREQVGKGGIVRDEAARLDAVEAVVRAASLAGFETRDRCESPITGAKGNVEYLLHLHRMPIPSSGTPAKPAF